MTLKRGLILVLFLCIYIRLISGFPLDNALLPGGTDTAVHLFRAWHVTTKGLTKWNYYFTGGEPFLRYYPPLAYAMAGALGRMTGFLFAYKFVNNIFFILAPIAFFWFLKQFNLSSEKMAVALIFFTLMPIYPFYFVDGRYTSTINLVFCLLYWIYLKKTLDDPISKNVLMGGIFLSLSILTHQLTTLIIIPITLVWAMFYRTKVKTIYGFSTIILLAFLLTSWWTIPYVLEMSGQNQSGTLLKPTSPIKMQREIGKQILALPFFSSSRGPELTFLLFFATSLFCSLSLFTLKDKNTQHFMIVAIIMVLILLTVRFKRIFIFIPIPLSILISQGAHVLKKKLRFLSLLIFFLILSLSFFSIRPITYPYPEYPDLSKDGRVLFYPLGTSPLLAPMHRNENIFGWYPTPQETIGKTFTPYSLEKLRYGSLLSDPLSVDQDEYHQLLREGWVNYLVIGKSYSQIIDYFDESDKFRIRGINQNFTVFEVIPKSSYVEINGNDVKVEVLKDVDEILVDMNCDPGKVVIKETYHKNWVSSVNGDIIPIKQTDRGFMEMEIDKKGPCSLKLSFKESKYYYFSFLTSLASWVGIALYFVNALFKFRK